MHWSEALYCLTINLLVLGALIALRPAILRLRSPDAELHYGMSLQFALGVTVVNVVFVTLSVFLG